MNNNILKNKFTNYINEKRQDIILNIIDYINKQEKEVNNEELKNDIDFVLDHITSDGLDLLDNVEFNNYEEVFEFVNVIGIVKLYVNVNTSKYGCYFFIEVSTVKKEQEREKIGITVIC